MACGPRGVPALLATGKLIVGNNAALGTGQLTAADCTTVDCSTSVAVTYCIILGGSLTVALDTPFYRSTLAGEPVRQVRELAKAADVTFVGVGQMGDDAPLLADGFVSAGELAQMQAAGAVGEVAGWVFDSQGCYLDLGTNDRTGGVRVEPGLDRPAIGIAAGASKVAAISGALKSRILNGLITDEATASALLARA